MKPLLIIPSPRDIPLVKEHIDNIKGIDKLWVKYYSPEIEAYSKIRYLLLEDFNYKDYTHIIISPDDLLITQRDIDTLLSDLMVIGTDETVITGYCNVDTTAQSGSANITINRVSPNRWNRNYNWLSLNFLRSGKYSFQKDPTYPFVKVGFAGFALFCIPRNIFTKIRFKNDSPSGYDFDGCCVDVMFCHDIYENNFQILCDYRLELKHLKFYDGKYSNWMADKKTRIVIFDQMKP